MNSLRAFASSREPTTMMELSMTDEAVLAQLMRQVAGRGVDAATLSALIEEASAAGAKRALASIGLHDERAGGDILELRELLRAWRDAKRSAVKAVAGWVVRMLLALVLVGIAVRVGDMFK